MLKSDLSFVLDMGLEQKFNKRIIGAVMGKRHVIEHELTEIWEKTTKKDSKDWIKGFLELGMGELKQNVKGAKNSVKTPKNIFWKKKKEEIDEDDSW